MKERIFLCLLLATVSLLCSCSEQRYVPDSISSHAEITAKPRTTRSEKSTTLPGPEPQEKELTMIVNGMALDVSWEDNETVEELLVYAQNGTITVNTTIYGGFEQVGSLPQSFSRNDVQMTTEPGDIVLYSGNQLVVFFSSNTWNYTKLGHINLAAEKLAGLLGGELSRLLSQIENNQEQERT